jgi:uncharacterized protein
LTFDCGEGSDMTEVPPAAAPPAPAQPHKGRNWLENLSHWAIVRIVIYVLVIICALVITKLATAPFIPAAPSPLHAPLLITANLGSAVLLLCAYALAVKGVERRAASEVDPRSGALPFLVGSVLGAGLMASVFLILWKLGLARFLPGTGAAGLAGILAASFATAVLEELLLRAIVFRIVEQAAGTSAGLVFSAVLFGLLHAINPGATPFSSAAIALEAGVLLAVAFVITRSLWLPIGIHMSWNFVQGGLFGAQVSGFAPSHSLVRTVLDGPTILTGGAFGPEASVVSMGVCTLASIAFAVLILRRSEWRPRVWRLWLA